MSVFDSLYEEEGEAPAPPPNPASQPDVPAGPLASPTMSLQDFATEVFGTRNAPSEPVSPGEAALADLPMTALALATPLAPPPPVDEPADETAPPSDSPFGGPPPADPPALDALDSFDSLDSLHDTGGYTLLEDDLLPVRKPRRRRSAPSFGGGRDVSGRTLVLLVVVALAAGFLGFRTLLGGGGGSGAGSDAASAGALPGAQPSGTDQGGAAGLASGPVGALEAAQLAAAEAELRQAAVQAQVLFADAGSYPIDPGEWTAALGRAVSAVGAATPAGSLEVVSDNDAVCFQTALPDGSVVAAGVTGEGLTFAKGPAGTALCTADAAVLSAWAPSLVL